MSSENDNEMFSFFVQVIVLKLVIEIEATVMIHKDFLEVIGEEVTENVSILEQKIICHCMYIIYVCTFYLKKHV